MFKQENCLMTYILLTYTQLNRLENLASSQKQVYVELN